MLTLPAGSPSDAAMDACSTLVTAAVKELTASLPAAGLPRSTVATRFDCCGAYDVAGVSAVDAVDVTVLTALADAAADRLAVLVTVELGVELRVTAAGVALALADVENVPDDDAVGVDDSESDAVDDLDAAADADSDGVSDTTLLMRFTVKKAPRDCDVDSDVKTKRSAVAFWFEVNVGGSV